VNAPTANTIAAAEHGIAMLCALSRNIAQADKSVKEGAWERKKYVGVSLVDKTLAIIGFGKVCIRLFLFILHLTISIMLLTCSAGRLPSVCYHNSFILRYRLDKNLETVITYGPAGVFNIYTVTWQ
jgi:hypothetical protein